MKIAKKKKCTEQKPRPPKSPLGIPLVKQLSTDVKIAGRKNRQKAEKFYTPLSKEIFIKTGISIRPSLLAVLVRFFVTQVKCQKPLPDYIAQKVCRIFTHDYMTHLCLIGIMGRTTGMVRLPNAEPRRITLFYISDVLEPLFLAHIRTHVHEEGSEQSTTQEALVLVEETSKQEVTFDA